MGEHGLHGAERFDNDIVDILDESVYVVALLLQVAPHKRERAFVAYIVVGSSLIEDEVLAVLVDGVVCEMHEQILKVALDRRLEWLSSEPGQPFIEHEHSERVTPKH